MATPTSICEICMRVIKMGLREGGREGNRREGSVNVHEVRKVRNTWREGGR